MFKLLVQEVIGNGTALLSEIAVRGKDIAHELEYVASDLIVGTVVEAAFVWLLAPTLPTLIKANAGPLKAFLARLPAHVFQPSTAAQQFSPLLRVAALVNAGMQYAVIGFGAGVVGTAITYGLVEGRRRLQKGYEPERSLPAVVPNALAWGAFMGVSSNVRFQLVEGVEVVLGRVLSGNVRNLCVVGLRFGNNYWGGVQFVKFFRWLGLHEVGEAKTDTAIATAS